MSLAPGTRHGPHEAVAPLGAGGQMRLRSYRAAVPPKVTTRPSYFRMKLNHDSAAR